MDSITITSFSLFLSDGGRAGVGGAAFRERCESGSVCGPAETGRSVVSGSPHPQRPVSTAVATHPIIQTQ